MKHIKHIAIYIVFLMPIILFTSCDEDDDGTTTNEQLTAVLLDDFSVGLGEEVVIDFSESIIPGNTSGNFVLTYQNGPAPIITSDGNRYELGRSVLQTPDKEETFSFTPQVNGQYDFLLELTSGNTFSNDRVVVTVSGIVELNNSMLANLDELIDITPFDNTVIDYQVNEMLILDSKTLTINNGVHIAFGENAGIIVDNGGELTNFASNGYGAVSFTGENWKGILIKSGDLRLINAVSTISGAGASAFEGYEAAAITVDEGNIEFDNSIFENSSGINLNLLENAFVTGQGIYSNTFDQQDAIHSSFFNINLIRGNTFSDAEAVVTLNGQGETSLSTNDNAFNIAAGNTNYHFTNGVSLGKPISLLFEEGKNLTMDENTGLVLTAGGTISGKSANSSIISGVNGTGWKGILSGGSLALENVHIDNAGSAAHTITGNDIQSALYVNNNSSFTNVEINNSGGYGFYSANNSFPNLSTVTFSNCAQEALILPIDFVGAALSSSITFSNETTSIPAILLKARASNSSAPEITIPDLNDDNFYRIDQNLDLSVGFTQTLIVEEGVNIKFDNGSSLTIGNRLATDFRGTEANPIIFEATDLSAGWGGVFLNTMANVAHSIDYLNISGGGNVMFTGATEQGNFVVKDTQTSSSNINFDFTNCTFTDSKGWGVVLEISDRQYDFLAAENANTFLNNATGDFLDRNN
jgi:hypothetical protein